MQQPKPLASEADKYRRTEIVRPVMPELDTLRGVAVLLVLFFHGFGMLYGLNGLHGAARWFVAATLPGWAGVNLFFILSGFLITGILMDSQKRPDYFRRFYFRRCLRILPAYYAFLLLFGGFSYFVAGAHPSSFIFLSVLYLANLTPLFAVTMLYAPLWTLAVEEHFYMLWPLMIKHNVGAYISVMIVLVCPILRGVAFESGHSETQYTWFVADGLALGSIFAISTRTVIHNRKRLGFLAITSLVVAMVTFLLGARSGILQASRLLGASLRTTVLNILFLGIVASFLFLGTGRWKTVVDRPIFRFFGNISYGLYLIHLLIFDAFNRAVAGKWAPAQGNFLSMVYRFICAGAISIVIAWVSRWYFEERFLRLKNRWPAASLSTLTHETPPVLCYDHSTERTI
jgi:peptidoglycan/LPS O-acetylase OafA/YrhL